jgi:hypothetical protein
MRHPQKQETKYLIAGGNNGNTGQKLFITGICFCNFIKIYKLWVLCMQI